jgi:6-phosphogluconolactonase
MLMHHWVHEHRFPDPTGLAQALAGEIKVDLDEAVTARGAASLVVSGGRTPVALFEALRTERLDWSRVRITLADERWVDVSDAASNERLVRATLLRDAAAAAQLTGLHNAARTPEAGAEWAWTSVGRLPRPFDVVVLGMGDDGHTASLFPGAAGIESALDPSALPGCVAIHAPVAPHARLTLNLAALLDARRVILHIVGREKWRVYQGALEQGPRTAMPVRAVLHQQQVPVDVYWSP